MTNYRPSSYNPWPPVVKNIIIINGLFALATVVFAISYKINLEEILGLYKLQSPHFKVFQLITHMFMHASVMENATGAYEPIFPSHFLFNMFALWMFGAPLENVWGPQKFLSFFLITGLGAAVVQLLAGTWDLHQIDLAIDNGSLEAIRARAISLDIPTIGASGAVFGVLIGFAVLFPNTEMIFLLFPIPIKAKYMVGIYIAIELFQGVQKNPADNVAHFAHLGGALFGFIIVKIWQRDRTSFY